jgi:hypothetical protein
VCVSFNSDNIIGEIKILDYQSYQEFVVQASHCSVDEVSFRLLRAASGLLAEYKEFCDTDNEANFNQERGDVLFWLTVLDYWMQELDVELEDPKLPEAPSALNFSNIIYIHDRIEKYSRSRDKSKLSGVSFVLLEIFDELMISDVDGSVNLSEIMTLNYDKLSATPRERK